MKNKNKYTEFLLFLFGLVVFLLPLERLGSIGYAGVNIRLSQILVIFILVTLYFYHRVIVIQTIHKL